MKMKKLFAYLLMGALLLGLLASCGGDKPDPAESAESSETVEEVDPNTDPKYLELKALLRGKLSEFQIVRGDTMKEADVKVVVSFRQTLRSEAGEEIRVATDFEYSYPRMDREIVIGKTTLEGKYYTLPETSKNLEKGAYAIDVIDSRVILSYGDRDGMLAGLEFLLIAMVKADRDVLVQAFSNALVDNGIQRFPDFSMNNYFADGMKLSSNSELLCYGKARAGQTVSVGFYRGDELLGSTESVVDADGRWSLRAVPKTYTTEMRVLVNGILVRQYKNLTCVKRILGTPDSGMRIFINGVEQQVLETEAGIQVIASLPDAATKSMDVVIRYPHRSVDVRPLSENIQAVSDQNEVRFTVDSFPKKLSVEMDRSVSKSVQMFLYPYDDTDVTKLDSKVIYFAPGEYTLQSKIFLKSNETLYLEEGAIVHAHVSAENAENISIMGRGVIDTFPLAEVHMIELENCRNVRLQDFTLMGARKWMVKLVDCTNCTVSTMNILGTQVNSDGVDIVGGQNVTVENSYLRNNDDCIAIKSMGREVKNVRITGNVFFNDKYGNALEIGYETRCDSISDVVFEDNDVIRILGGAVFSIHLGDRANVSDIHYRNIRVEDCDVKLVEFFIRTTQYTQDETRGTISDVTFENIAIDKEALGKVTLLGFDGTHLIDGVHFSNVTCGGETVDASKVRFEINDYVNDVIWNGTKLK